MGMHPGVDVWGHAGGALFGTLYYAIAIEPNLLVLSNPLHSLRGTSVSFFN
jgi:hypothetical protein